MTVREVLGTFADPAMWHRTTHRPEVPGPADVIVYFSKHGWNSEDLEPWTLAQKALDELDDRG